MRGQTRNHCPVCRAPFRGAAQCTRCGADLSRIMLLALSAARLRNAARAAVCSGDYARASILASTAQRHCPTGKGQQLKLLTQWIEALRQGK